MEKIAPLTGLRGIAAYAVLIAHAVDAGVSGRGLPHSIAVGLAYFGMSLFFVLSGFVICYNYENKVLSPYGRWQFFGLPFAGGRSQHRAVLCAASSSGYSADLLFHQDYCQHQLHIDRKAIENVPA